MPSVGDAEVYLAGAVAILAEYPAEVGAALADPASGTRVIKDFATLSDLRRACEDLYEPIERAEHRGRVAEEHRLMIAQRWPPRTPEQQAVVEAQVKDWRRVAAEIALHSATGAAAGGRSS